MVRREDRASRPDDGQQIVPIDRHHGGVGTRNGHGQAGSRRGRHHRSIVAVGDVGTVQREGNRLLVLANQVGDRQIIDCQSDGLVRGRRRYQPPHPEVVTGSHLQSGQVDRAVGIVCATGSIKEFVRRIGDHGCEVGLGDPGAAPQACGIGLRGESKGRHRVRHGGGG